MGKNKALARPIEKAAQKIGPFKHPPTHLDFIPIMHRWERWRIYYNGILIPYVLILTLGGFPQHATDLNYWLSIFRGGLIANICYLTAPTIEAYAIYQQMWNRTFALLLFLAGLSITGLIAFFCIASYP